MTAPANKYGPESTVNYVGEILVVDQITLGAVGSAKTASATSGAATLNSPCGVVTSESLTTAAGATYTLTLTNSCIAATDIVNVSLGNGTNSAGQPSVATVTPAAGSVVIKVQNIHASAALNGTLTFGFDVIKV